MFNVSKTAARLCRGNLFPEASISIVPQRIPFI